VSDCKVRWCASYDDVDTLIAFNIRYKFPVALSVFVVVPKTIKGIQKALTIENRREWFSSDESPEVVATLGEDEPCYGEIIENMMGKT
jgi:hypothetical protein